DAASPEDHPRRDPRVGGRDAVAQGLHRPALPGGSAGDGLSEDPMGAPPSPLLRAALAAHARGDLGEAERLYRELLAADPDQFDALHNLGHVRVLQGRHREAVDCFKRALRRRPDAAATHNMLASALRGAGRYDEAVAHYRRALALRPDYA